MATKITATKGGHTVTVDCDGGDVKVSVNGVAGASCKDITKNIEAALGKTVSSDNTPEMYQAKGARVRA